MKTLFLLLARLPLWILQGIGAFVGWLAFWGSPTYRGRLREQAGQACLNGAARRAAVAAAGRMVAELPRMWLGRVVPVRWTGREWIEAAQAKGQGILFLTPHLGCFEITARAYAESCGDITVLFRPARKAWLEALVAQGRRRARLHPVPTTVGGVKAMLKALRLGQAVGLLPDQVPPQGQGVWAPFFERPAYTMTLVGRLVQQSGATVLLAWGERLSWGRGYVVHVLPGPTAWPADAMAAASLLNQQMEALIRQAPHQYLWGYARYKAPREGA